MRVQLTHSRNEGGAIAVLAVALSVAVFVITAFSVDLGMAYAQRQAIYSGADSAALAVVDAFKQSELKTPRTCKELLDYDSALAATSAEKSRNIALRAINANAPFGQTISASDITVTPACVGTDNKDANGYGGTMEVTVKVSRTIKTTVARVIGIGQMEVNRVAAADLGVANQVTGLLPLGICTYQAEQIVANAEADKAANVAYRAEIIGLNKIWAGNKTCDGGGGAGNWGWLDLGQGNGADKLGGAIASGGPSPIALTINPSPSPASAPMSGNPGNKGNSDNVADGFDAIWDHKAAVPVYDTYSENGNNATYRVIGFLSIQVCGFDGKYATYSPTCYDPSRPTGNNEIQVRFAGYSPMGTIDDLCGIGLTCANNTYVTRLVK